MLVLVLGITVTVGTTTDVPKPALDPPDVDVLDVIDVLEAVIDELGATKDWTAAGTHSKPDTAKPS